MVFEAVQGYQNLVADGTGVTGSYFGKVTGNGLRVVLCFFKFGLNEGFIESGK